MGVVKIWMGGAGGGGGGHTMPNPGYLHGPLQKFGL